MQELPKLYSRNTKGGIQEWTVFIDGDTYFTEAGQVGGAITKSKPTVCEAKNTDKANATTGNTQAFAEAHSKWQKQKDKGYTEDISKVDEAQEIFFKPMLAHKYDDHKDKIQWPKKFLVKLEDGSSREIDANRLIKLTSGNSIRGYELKMGDDIEISSL